MISSIIHKHIFVKIQPNMSEQEKKQGSIYDLLNNKTKTKKLFQNNWSFFMASIKPRS